MERKTNKSRLIMVTLFIVALFMLYPSRIVKASDYYNLWVGETQVSSDNAGNILGNGTASYDSVTCTLRLNNPNICNPFSYNGATYGIYSTLPSLTISGSAEISGFDYAIAVNENCNLLVNGTETGIIAKGNICGIRGSGSGDLTLQGIINASGRNTWHTSGDAAGICNIRDEKRGNTTINGDIKSTGYYGIYVYNLTINGGEIVAKGNDSAAIVGTKSVTINGGITKVTATTEGNTYAICSSCLDGGNGVVLADTLFITKPVGGYVVDGGYGILDPTTNASAKDIVISSTKDGDNSSEENSNENGTNNNDNKTDNNNDKHVTIPSFKLNTSSVVIQKGKTLKTVKATLTNDEIKSVESANSKIATVSYSGTTLSIKGIKKGSTKITVTTKSGLLCKLNVKVQTGKVTTTKLKVSKKSVNLASKGSIATVKATASPDYVSTKEKITVKSSNKKIATAKIDQETGEITITAKKKGSCKITVKAGKKTVTIKVKVKK